MTINDRHAKRAILLTPDDRVLLMRVDYGNGCWWITPGGGAEAGESPEQTLRRELAEELGYAPATIGPLLWRRQHLLTLYQRRWRQCEDYFLIETEAFDPRVQNAPEARTIREFRWWTLAELRHTGERIVPPALCRIVRDFRSQGAPQGPLDIDLAED
ncbi:MULTISPECIES: NUDIX hydrolase [unclassified Paracoccus (in: a-proteobacteria)]|uniref:NUDIX hydrolase n=1 Tax=unclassified Paracoccus (in: a-proteobacteria) TaxID=2688777 RepID=UPI0012B2F622|nr:MULTISPECIES: NUDIX domain-containing protein [unclassified Paracoccus (in: a-proteobacteria)]UXU74232.1 NUDIX domain-containing protein [Paracoccus sp. SMMA_5]UXU80123.1 NUDIX domain-containing protein [Paracoccus sp. SMMA_5_TC]